MEPISSEADEPSADLGNSLNEWALGDLSGEVERSIDQDSYRRNDVKYGAD